MRNVPSSLALLVLVVLPFCHKLVFCAQVNRTIDDSLGDLSTGQPIIYTPPLNPPPSLWVDQTCQGCSVLPDPSQAFNRTFHGATYNPSGSNPISFRLNFTGIAVYVFFTVVNNVNTFVDFTMDDKPAGTYQHNANTELTTQYQLPVFARTDLGNGHHSLLVSAAPSTVFSYVNFDYAIYTQIVLDLPAPSSSDKTPTLSQNFTSRQPSKSSLSAIHSLSARTSKGTLLPDAHSTPAQRAKSVITLSNAVTQSTSMATTNSTPTATPTPKSAAASPQTNQARLVIAAEVLGPIAIVAAAGLLLRYRRVRNQAKRKKQDPTPFTDGPRGDSASDVPEMFVPASKRNSRGRVSALLAEKVRDDLRRTRQGDIDQRLRTLRGEIVEISSKLSARGAMAAADSTRSPVDHQHTASADKDTVSSRRLRRIIRAKRRQMEHHEQQRQSPWALGLSEESPFGDANVLL